MESSPKSNHPPIDARDARVIADIDATLAEFDAAEILRKATDHIMALQGITLDQDPALLT